MSANAARFGQIVRARRLALGDLTQIDVWRRGGPSNSTLTAIEGGEWKPNGATFRKLDAALEWEPGSARRAWDGGQPTPATPRPEAPAHRRTAVDASDAEIVAEVARRMNVAREERDRGRDTPATTPARESPASEPDLPDVADRIVTRFRVYAEQADEARRSRNAADAAAWLARLRSDFEAFVTAELAQVRHGRAQNAG